jgi:hypothetical protein
VSVFSFSDLAFMGAVTVAGSYDPDAQSYITAVETADGQALETGVRDAINAFVVGCKADGIWTAIKASCIMAGARTLAGALVPLVGTAPTNFNFVSEDYNRKTGLLGNEASKYLDSNYTLLTSLQNNRHASAYVTQPQMSSGGTIFYFGTGSTTDLASTQLGFVQSTPNDLITRCSNTASSQVSASLNGAGLAGVARGSSTAYTVRGNGQTVTQTVSSAEVSERSLIVFARRFSNALGIQSHTNARLASYSIGESLDLALLDARVTALINAYAAAIS